MSTSEYRSVDAESDLPIGATELAALASFCERTGVQLISDEIYHGISYDGAPATSSAWSTSREAVIVNSFSKYFSMTGWRLGWMVVPVDLLRPVERLAQNLFIAPPTLPQHAAQAVFDCRDELDANVRRYRASPTRWQWHPPPRQLFGTAPRTPRTPW